MAPVLSVVRALPNSNAVKLFSRTTSFLSHDKVEYRAQSNATSERERAKTVAAYYNQPAIEAAAKKVGHVVMIGFQVVFCRYNWRMREVYF